MKARKGQSNYGPVDIYTVMHAALGGLWGAAGFSPNVAIISTIGWESIEPYLKLSDPRMFPYATKDAPVNKVGDSVAFMIAYYVFRDAFNREQ